MSGNDKVLVYHPDFDIKERHYNLTMTAEAYAIEEAEQYDDERHCVDYPDWYGVKMPGKDWTFFKIGAELDVRYRSHEEAPLPVDDKWYGHTYFQEILQEEKDNE